MSLDENEQWVVPNVAECVPCDGLPPHAVDVPVVAMAAGHFDEVSVVADSAVDETDDLDAAAVPVELAEGFAVAVLNVVFSVFVAVAAEVVVAADGVATVEMSYERFADTVE